jgi:hypothetical protein
VPQAWGKAMADANGGLRRLRPRNPEYEKSTKQPDSLSKVHSYPKIGKKNLESLGFFLILATLFINPIIAIS